MIGVRNINPMVRAIATMGAIAALVGGVTFAALTSNTVALTGNELDVTSDILRISNGGAFGTTATGFSNANLVVGNESTKQPFYLQNLANANLALTATIPGAPAGTNLDLTKVHVKIYDKDGTTVDANTTIAALEAGQVPLTDQLDANAQGNGGAPGTEGNYFYSVTVDPSAVLGSSAGVPSFDLDFTGTSL